MCVENRIFTALKNPAVKNLLLFLLLMAGAATASAQTATIGSIGDTLARPGMPVLRSYVPPDVVARVVKKYGRSLYCIEKTQKAGCENSYLVGLIKNGSLVIEWMCDDPKLAQRTSGLSFGKEAG